MPRLVLPILLMLAGCQNPGTEIVLPGVEPEPPELLLGHVPGGLPEGFYDDAALMTRAAIERYVALSDEITAQGGEGAERIAPMVSPEWRAEELSGFSYFEREGLRSMGVSTVSRFLVQSARLTPGSTVEVGAIACVDTTDVLVFPRDTADPPEILWQWHPHYEDFEGEESDWALIEQFLETPDLSWGSSEAVVFWFEGPTMESLVLTSTEPWWGVYSCPAESLSQ